MEGIDIEEIKKHFNLYSKDEAEIDWFDDYDLEREYMLRDLGMDDSDMIAHLETMGYIIAEEYKDNLDYIDPKRLEEIVERFKVASWAEKEEIYQKIIIK